MERLDLAARIYLDGVLFVAGAASLVLEIAGARLLSPYYGSSLYCWSALITVTLAALAAGYTVGGRLADRPSLQRCGRLLLCAGAAVALLPWLRIPVLAWTSPLGIRLGALCSALLLLAPPLLFLSSLCPLVIRLTADSVQVVGRRAGRAFALSTLGSVAGALLGGFVLIPALPLSRLLTGLATLLLLWGCVRVPLRRSSPVGLGLIVLVLLAGREQANDATILHRQPSFYGEIRVVEGGGLRVLAVDGTVQSLADAADFEPRSAYLLALEWAALLRPQAGAALVIGAGAGLLPRALERHYGLVTDAVEIDPHVIDVARRFFGYAPRGQVFIEDGRAHLSRTTRRYGLVVVDAFSAEAPPAHLLTREALQDTRRVLAPDGVLAINLVSIIDGAGDEAWLSVHRTLREVFKDARAFQEGRGASGVGHVLLFASDGPLPVDEGAAREARPAARRAVAEMLAAELRPGEEDLRRAVLLRDDHAPLEHLLAGTALRWRQELQRSDGTRLLPD